MHAIGRLLGGTFRTTMVFVVSLFLLGIALASLAIAFGAVNTTGPWWGLGVMAWLVLTALVAQWVNRRHAARSTQPTNASEQPESSLTTAPPDIPHSKQPPKTRQQISASQLPKPLRNLLLSAITQDEEIHIFALGKLHSYYTPDAPIGKGYIVLTSASLLFVPTGFLHKETMSLSKLDDIQTIEVKSSWFTSALVAHCGEDSWSFDTTAKESRIFVEVFERVAREASEDLDEAVQSIVDEHFDTLRRQRALKLRTDAYGVVLHEAWDKELKGFMERVVVPHLISTIGGARAGLGLRTSGQDLTEMVAVCFEARDSLTQDASGDHFDHTALTQPSAFEQACSAALQDAGWETQVMGGSGDQGVDVVARSASLTFVVQCKLYAKPLGNSAIQEVFAGKAHYGADLAAVVSNADYTTGARDLANTTGTLLLHYSELENITPSHLVSRIDEVDRS